MFRTYLAYKGLKYIDLLILLLLTVGNLYIFHTPFYIPMKIKLA
jgi:hypothetical protein